VQQAGAVPAGTWPTIKVNTVKVIKIGQGSIIQVDFVVAPKEKWQKDADIQRPAVTAAKPEAANPPERPNVGTVRVNEAGDTVGAGHAPPNAHVRIMVAGKLAGTVTAEGTKILFVPKKE